ncbi:MAG: family 43 glycosylhydrolase [Bryobacteraceae bacterium]|jgi:arabinan endo-1,5-alpha-L-arabinosidase
MRLYTLPVTTFFAFFGLAAAQVFIDTSLRYELVNKNSLLALSVQSASTTAGEQVTQLPDNDVVSQLWLFMAAGNNQYKIVNVNSGEMVGITNASRIAGTTAIQWADNGTADHLWEIVDAGGGYCKIRSVNSGLLLNVDGASTLPGASVVQSADSGGTSELWELVPAGPAYPPPALVTGDINVHDPSMIRTPAGTYYLFGTHQGLLMQSSPDRIHFTAAGQAFSAIPAWTAVYSPAHDLWAPDISWHNGKYWLYYAASGFGSNVSAIGLATSSTAAPGSFEDQGMVISSDTRSPYNAIDPGLVVDTAGGWWLSFGSWSDGINMIQIDPATGKQASWNNNIYLLAQRPADPAIEGSYVYVHDGYYYLFASFDVCCNGVNSTYHIAAGRSTNVSGPYFDKGGMAMSLGGGTILLGSHGRFIGPGGQVMMHDADGDLLVYHYYDSYANGAPTLGISRIGWDPEGWPYLCGGHERRGYSPESSLPACFPPRGEAPPLRR